MYVKQFLCKFCQHAPDPSLSSASRLDCSRSIAILCVDSGRFLHSFDYIDTTANDDDSAAAKAAALKKATDEFQVAAAVAVLAWPTAWYDSLIPSILVYIFVVYVMYIDVLVQGFIRASMFSLRYEMHAVNVMFTICLLIKLTEYVQIYPTDS